MIEEFNYKDLIGSTLYLKNIPYYTIDNIIDLENNHYKLYFSDIFLQFRRDLILLINFINFLLKSLWEYIMII